MFQHPKCGGRHETVAEARACEAGQRRPLERTEHSDRCEHVTDFPSNPVREPRPSDSFLRPQHWEGRVSVPAGRYAVVEDDRTNVINFYKVDRPEDGRWAGYVFVNQQVSDTEYPVKNRTRKAAVLAAIGVNVREAMERYGRELGECGHCGRTLTNDESRERGIGPVCASKMGW